MLSIGAMVAIVAPVAVAGCASDASNDGDAVVSDETESDDSDARPEAQVDTVPADTQPAAPGGSILGSWMLADLGGCETVYPSAVEFVDGGVYGAPTGPDEGAVLHGGDWELDGDTLAMQAANDAMLRYRVSQIGPEALVIVDADGCEIRYARTDG